MFLGFMNRKFLLGKQNDVIITFMPKIFEIWPGNNRFYCDYCITGPSKDWAGMVCINICSLIVIILYSIFVVNDNWQITPALPIILYISIMLMVVFLFMTACTDPGIIPRKPFLQRFAKQNQRLLHTHNPGEKRFCQTCFIIRPDRASHCSRCQNCVEIFDHHCSVLGNCIGKRNYRYFILFLTFAFSSMAILIINLITFIINKTSGDVNQTIVIVVISIVAGIFFIPLIGFFLFHLYLTIAKKTTRQVIKNISTTDYQVTQNQWCCVDDANINFFQEISEKQSSLISEKIDALRKPIMQMVETLYPIPLQ